MYQIKVLLGFCGAHYLRNYHGKCENIHGHNWKVEVVAQKPSLDKCGLVLDFRELKRIVKSVLERLDHHNLNEDIDFFKENNPTSENIAFYIFSEVKKRINDYDCSLKNVTVWETDNCAATYEE